MNPEPLEVLSVLDEGLEPWGGVKAVLAAGSPLATHAVDTTGFLDRGIESLTAHAAHLAGLGQQLDPEEFLESFGRMTGSRIGTTFTVSFEVPPLQPS